ncbi:hypothetical protein GCM10010124_26240 [Pilimelia terevasa]|uniref:Uncharacterized protein n=1 Tax=Pilimelia terevasa TaxID=53372 RepID=A0A8J3BSI2_9ACTN|nr:hypothetical protein [Pilimelia terevasa]GGK32195.1 hypothetical protein GCM10010124_26240 [Pilimelia terevasa]
MPFPGVPLPVRVYLDPGGAPADPGSWAWTDITGYVRDRDGIEIAVGRPDERGEVGPGRCTLRLDNTDGRFSPRNPLGAWYGELGRNTPIRVALAWLSDTFGRTVVNGWGTSSSGHAWTLSGTAADFDVTAGAGTIVVATAGTAPSATLAPTLHDVSARITGTLSTANVTGNQAGFGVDLRGGTSGAWSCMALVNADESVTAIIYGRTGAVLASATVPTLTHSGQALTVRGEASGTDLRVRVWAAAGAEPAVWHATAAATDLDPGTVGVLAYRHASNTNAGLTVTFDNFGVEVERFTGLVSEWPPRWDLSGNDATTPIVANGILRRLAQGQAPAAPALRRAIGVHSPVAHWPLDDGASARSGASLVPGGTPLAAAGTFTWSDGTPPLGATGCVRADGVYNTTLGTTLGVLKGSAVPNAAAAAGWTFVLWERQVNAWAAGQTMNTYGWIYDAGGSGTVWVWQINHQTQQIDCAWYSDANTFGGAVGSLTTIDILGDWRQIAVTLAQAGADISAAVHITSSYDGAPVATYTAASTVAGRTLGAPDRLELWIQGYTGAGVVLPVAYLSTCALLPAALTTAQLTALGEAGFGGSGQTAVQRIAALCAQEGVPVHLPGVDHSSVLGAQPARQLLDLIREAERTDAGVLYERGGGLAYRPRADTYNAAADLTIGWEHTSPAPEPTDDDQRLRNRIVASRENAESVTVEDAASIAAAGLYEDPVQVSLPGPGMLPSHATWRLRAGTITDQRYPAIGINLAGQTALADGWLGCQIGSRIDLVDPPAGQAPDDAPLILEGWTERLHIFGWDLELATSPATVYRVGVYDDTDLGRADTGGSQLNSAATAGATSLSVLTTVPPTWSTTAVPYDIAVGGERITVTAVTAAVANVQTFTVVRAVNGVAKAHAAGAPVSLWAPVRYAL